MSSIFGVWNRNNEPVQKEMIDIIVSETAWWNPISTNTYINEAISLVHWGLHTTPNSTLENLPNVYDSLGISINCDTRIDNREEVEKLLNVSSGKLKESELILKLFLKFKEKCLLYLKGAFSIAIWDNKEKRLFLARDQMGCKPLNYNLEKNRFAFATQKLSLLKLPNFNNVIDWNNVINRMIELAEELHSTEYTNIKVFPPAHFAWITKNSFELKRYWEIDTTLKTKYKNDQEYIDQFIHLFKQSVRRRMVNLKTVGTHLSGGLDSSGITGVAQHIAVNEQNREINPLSYIVPRHLSEDQIPWDSENKYVFKQLEFSNISTPHLVDEPFFRSFWDKLTHEVKVIDGISRSNNVSTEFEIQKRAQEEGIDVILSGFGGDECVTSFTRPYYLEYLDRNQFIKMLQSVNSEPYVPLNYALISLFVKLKRPLIGRTFEKSIVERYELYKYNKRVKINKIDFDFDIFNPTFITSSDSLQAALDIRPKNAVHDQIPINLREYQKNHITRSHTNLRMESEILSAKNFHLDYRYPMMDIDLIQYVISLPLEQKYNVSDKTRRYLYRRGLQSFCPNELISRNDKTGHLKPMSYFYTKKKDRSLAINLLRLLDEGHLDFLNIDYIKKKFLSQSKLPPSIKSIIIMAHLKETQRINYL